MSRILLSSDPGTRRVHPHPPLKHSKSLTSRGPWVGFALDPIQRLPWIALGAIQVPGQIDRRYGNPRVACHPRVVPTRGFPGPLSPEARSCAARGAAGWCGTARSRPAAAGRRGVPQGYGGVHPLVQYW